MKRCYVRGIGLWTPGSPDAASWCSADPDPEVEKPLAPLLSGSLRRRATWLTRIAIDAMGQASEQAGCDPVHTPSVWATAHGEHSTAIAILAMMHRGEGKLSPTAFHNSVHNSASGYASIAAGNTAPSTTLTGGSELVASSFLEAQCLLEAGGRDVLLVLADEPLQSPFERSGSHNALALAFCLSHDAGGALATLSGLRRAEVAPAKRHERFGSLYVSAALPLLERIVLGRPGTVALEFEADASGPVACVDLEIPDSIESSGHARPLEG